MTAALIAPADLSQYEFDIPCEFPGCKNEAAVSCKGCADARHRLICEPHHQWVRKFFYDQDAVVCKTCHRPWVHFDTHYEVAPL